MAGLEFHPQEIRGVYRAIHERRDIRQFQDDPVSPSKLARVLGAAHHGPSVGYMQPWDFILVSDVEVRGRVKDLFDRERQAAANFFDDTRRAPDRLLVAKGLATIKRP